MAEIEFGRNVDGLTAAPFILKIWDTGENELHILTAFSRIGERGEGERTGSKEIDAILNDCCPIMPDSEMIFEIIFPRYILYQTRNEYFCSLDDYEIRDGNHFTVYHRSRLLDQISVFTDCAQFSDGTFYPEKWRHYGICGQNHVIDIISGSEPDIYRRNHT